MCVCGINKRKIYVFWKSFEKIKICVFSFLSCTYFEILHGTTLTCHKLKCNIFKKFSPGVLEVSCLVPFSLSLSCYFVHSQKHTGNFYMESIFQNMHTCIYITFHYINLARLVSLMYSVHTERYFLLDILVSFFFLRFEKYLERKKIYKCGNM